MSVMTSESDARVHWPPGFEPARAPVFSHNELEIAVPPATVWAWLVAAPRWPELYANCTRMRITGGGDRLADRTRFTWRTFGVAVDTTVDGFVPERYLSWTGRGLGARGHHVWLIAPTPNGCRVVTEETQIGFVAKVLAPPLRRGLVREHQRWLEGFARAGLLGTPDQVSVLDARK